MFTISSKWNFFLLAYFNPEDVWICNDKWVQPMSLNLKFYGRNRKFRWEKMAQKCRFGEHPAVEKQQMTCKCTTKPTEWRRKAAKNSQEEPKPTQFRSEIRHEIKVSTSVRFVTSHLGLVLLSNTNCGFDDKSHVYKTSKLFTLHSVQLTCTRRIIFSNAIASDLPISLSRLSQFSRT